MPRPSTLTTCITSGCTTAMVRMGTFSLNLPMALAPSQAVSTIENATSGSGNDTLTGNAAGNSLSAGSGADVLLGGAGNDTVNGGGGGDQIRGGTGDDLLIGANGADAFRFEGDFGDDVIQDFIDVTDRIWFAPDTGVDDFTDLRITAELRGGVTGSLVTFGDGQDTLWLRLITPSQLGAGDFVFG